MSNLLNGDQIIYDADVMRDYNFTLFTINKHAREMGSFGRPRRFLRSNVEAYIQGQAKKSMIKAERRQQMKKTKVVMDRKAINAQVDNILRDINSRDAMRRKVANKK